jgi:hypothetical protein
LDIFESERPAAPEAGLRSRDRHCFALFAIAY